MQLLVNLRGMPCNALQAESELRRKKRMRLVKILEVLIMLPQRGEGVMFTEQEIMRGRTRIQFLIQTESSGLRMKPVL